MHHVMRRWYSLDYMQEGGEKSDWHIFFSEQDTVTSQFLVPSGSVPT